MPYVPVVACRRFQVPAASPFNRSQKIVEENDPEFAQKWLHSKRRANYGLKCRKIIVLDYHIARDIQSKIDSITFIDLIRIPLVTLNIEHLKDMPIEILDDIDEQIDSDSDTSESNDDTGASGSGPIAYEELGENEDGEEEED
ncbi:hypothetical protein EYC80_005311 [Monilinia laxa]|uniref:Uncharacterized protein n=1 Tax=Monilinia laxa TaxID=61186 RepID=A0A5N6KJI8_MONLA|nr:hypothetical protein EYC80_005311 [Monilinia laxa]